MRNVVHAARSLILAIMLAAGLPSAGTLAQESRVILTPDADYPGFDYETVKNVDLEACQASCMTGSQCRAFTYNNSARWCFLKTDFGTLVAAPGATAGRVVQTVELTPSLEATRLAQLEFVPGRYVDEARELAGSIKRRFFPPVDSAYQSLRDQGTAAYNVGNYDGAATLFGQALALADDNPGLWLDYAIANLARDPEDWQERQQAYADVTAASINGFVRSDTVDNQAKALAILGDGFARREEWKLSYRSYRASLALVEDPSVRDDYERVIAEHGFRIVSHNVDADIADPRICIVFSDDLPVSDPRLTDFVTVSGGEGLAVEPERRQICVTGVEHGGRYQIRVRGGLPAVDGEVLAHPVEIDVYVRDRAPWVGFAGNAYVLPSGPGASIPIVSVNTDKALAQIYRIGDRGIAYAIRNSQFMRSLAPWSAENIGFESGEKVWEGEILIQSELNKTITTAVPVTDAIPDMRPGVYVITAKAELDPNQWGQLATQWFVVSDLGMTALSGSDGIHAIVRSLSTAEPVAGAKLRLVAVNNDVLGEAVTDQNGYVRFDPGLARGTGGAAPQLIDATNGDGDYAFIDLRRSAFDLSDRGVDGRPAPGPLDVFVTPERGIYRPGETIHLTALVRDARAVAVSDLPLTLVVERPDGVEFLRETLSDGGLGGYSADVELEADAMRGSWQVRLYADPKGSSIAETSVLVEDFQPERLAFDLETTATAIGVTSPAVIDLTARYLYGATAPGLSIDGDIDIRPAETLAGFAGYHFGLAEEQIDPVREPIDLGAVTDEEGKATLEVGLPQLPVTTRPLQAQIIVRIADTNGRAVERRLTLPVTPEAPMIGIRPQFSNDEVEEGAAANFDVILVGADGRRIAEPGLSWRLERIVSDYQWYRSDGTWNYEIVTSAERIATGEVDTKADGPVTVSANVDWGRYRLTVERGGDEPAASSYEFYAGWYVSSATSQTPDVLEVALDKPAYKIGDIAKLRLDPRFAGIALVTVLDDRLISMQAVEVPEEGTSVDLIVTDQWGPGAYVTATLYRPMDVPAKRMPSRALGL
ncbi:MAG TPA: MG2 domain-containing protein, partial [Bauldia sp.]|nr:MG2 domain-containing protein [Bauldia sp.]